MAELVIGGRDLVEQEDLASSPGAGRDREQAVLGIGELVDPRATSVKDGRWSLNAQATDLSGPVIERRRGVLSRNARHRARNHAS
jgi:hypothetical protein